MPEPDGCVVTHEQMARQPHPNRAVLLIEVSDSSLELDQEMAFDYAASADPDYWIVNMPARQMEVYRDPVADASAVLGWRYASHRVYLETEMVSPLAKPDVAVSVADLVRTA